MLPVQLFTVIIIGILGALIGSFGNVVIYRLPRRENIAFPGSHCPNCNHAIKPWQNIPIVSWLMLRGRCANCKEPISIRYPLIEAVTALGFVLLALRWPVETFGLTVAPLLIIFAMIVMMSMIDVDHFILPDSLTLPALMIALAGTTLYETGSGLPTFMQAVIGASIGAGIIALINRVGSLVLRRFADTKERLWPIGMDQVNIAALGGALGGWLWGLSAAGASLLLNLVTRRSLRLPEPIMYGLWFVALVLASTGLIVDVSNALAGTFAAAGVAAVLGALYWWFYDMMTDSTAPEDADDDEPIAMGFGDVKLAAVLGAILGWQSLLVALFFSFLIGAVFGIISRVMGGDRQIPFGPYLALGGVLALFFGADIISWYLASLGLGG